jgi:RHS repeat-associated protein
LLTVGQYQTLYDNLNRGRAITTPASLTISLTFDGVGRRRTLIEPSGGTFSYGYDLANRNTLVINPQSERTSWTYDAAGRATVQRLSNLVRVSMAYDTADRLLRLANLTSTGTTLSSFRDTWDGAGNRQHRSEADGTLVSWSYDNSYQLTRERRDGANSYDTTYSYDGAGNRHLKLDNAVTTTYSYDAANQLTKYVNNTGTTTFAFDANGNQRLQTASAGGGTTTNTWDFENRLVKVALPSGVLNTFSYNGDGQRVQRADSTGTLKEVWDGQKILLETNTSNVTQVIYTLSPGVYGDLVSQRRSGVSRYFLFDPLGSASRLTDGNQNVTDSYLFKAFGESLLAVGPTTNPFQFLGRVGYYLDSNLNAITVRTREYEAAVGRWNSVDPLQFVQLSNPYLYGHNRPLVLGDPSGMISICIQTNNTMVPCGQKIIMRFIFSLVVVPHCDGYLVQHMTVWCDIEDCVRGRCPTHQPPEPCADFYEAWHIPPGESTPKTGLGYTDRWGTLDTLNTCGVFFAKATIKFFCTKVSGDLDKAWAHQPNAPFNTCLGKQCASITPGGLPAKRASDLTEDEQTWLESKSAEQAREHSLFESWNCCNPKCPIRDWEVDPAQGDSGCAG